MKIKVIETCDLFPNAASENSLLFRFLEINGKRYLQFQGRAHEAMPAFWANGILMTCPDNLTSSEVDSDYLSYLYGYGPGCEVCDKVPCELWHDL